MDRRSRVRPRVRLMLSARFSLLRRSGFASSVRRRASAQPPSAAELRAAVLVDLAKFAEWPPDAGTEGTVVFCAVDTPAVAAAFEQIITGARERMPQRWTVVRLSATAALQPQGSPGRRCHLLYAADFDARQAALLAAALAGAPVFTVGEIPGFAAAGGVAELSREHDTPRFTINLEAAQGARVRLAAPLLSLARIVKWSKRPAS
jgi:hypothetical protein